MRSKSRLTSRAVRRGVPLNTMCSRKWVTPDTAGVSSRAPVRTKKPRAADRADGLVSPMTCRPLDNVWLWKGMSLLSVGGGVSPGRGPAGAGVAVNRQGPRAEGDDAEV